jgi:hypothetical protein
MLDEVKDYSYDVCGDLLILAAELVIISYKARLTAYLGIEDIF